VTLEAGTRIGKYLVKRKLAEGGMAEIYLATSTGPEGFEKEVVIKRVRAFLAGDENFVKMFIAEAQLASRLNHANVVQIFDFDKHEDSYYLAMEYVRGCSLWELRKRCRDKGVSMPPVLVAHIGAQVAAGLNHAHRLKSSDGGLLGLVHRDVTPQNVLLSLDGAVKLTDFGIAKAGHTQSGMLKGKFAYMSPEQAAGEAVDARTDVFALGIVLWEMLTGGKLFDGDSDIAVLRAVRESVIVPPARLNPDVPESLDLVVSTALQRDPRERFQSAGELERALAQCVLSHARSLDDTDASTFVRRLLDTPLTQYIQVPAALMERSQPTGSERSTPGESPAVAGSYEPMPAPAREPTAVLPGSGASSGRSSRPVRPAPHAEEPLVSAPTLVLPPTAPSPASVASSPEGQGSAPKPSAPVRVSQGMPAITAAPEEPTGTKQSTGAKRGGKGLWVGVGVVGLTLIAGAAALVSPTRAPAPSASSSEAPAPAVSARTERAAVPEVKAEAPPAAAPAGSTNLQESDAGTMAAVPPMPEPTPATPVTAPAVQAKGTLIVRAIPFATVIVSGQKPREVQGTARFSLPPGNYKVSFQHPKGSEIQDVTITSNGSVTRSFTALKK
jgi:serine/threonine-protein kinase